MYKESYCKAATWKTVTDANSTDSECYDLNLADAVHLVRVK